MQKAAQVIHRILRLKQRVVRDIQLLENVVVCGGINLPILNNIHIKLVHNFDEKLLDDAEKGKHIPASIHANLNCEVHDLTLRLLHLFVFFDISLY